MAPSPQVIGLSSGGRVAGLAVGGGGPRCARAHLRAHHACVNPAARC